MQQHFCAVNPNKSSPSIIASLSLSLSPLTHSHPHTHILQGRCLEAAFLFAVLLNLKHIFLYMAPAYFVYLLKHYCFAAQTEDKTHCAPKMKDFLLKNFIKLGAIVVAVFVISFGPFIYMVSD